MFDNKIIVPDSLTSEENGFSLLARLPYYRGLGLSMVEDIAVTVDGEKLSRDAVRLSLHGNVWTQDEMETEYGDRWNFGEQAEILVSKSGGLGEGEHQVQVSIRMRVSDLPFVPTTSDTKVMTLQPVGQVV